MKEFNYILDKIKHASFEQEPFQHLYIKNFLSEEHFSQLISDKQVHFKECSKHLELKDQLYKANYVPYLGLGGCYPQEWDYYLRIKNNESLDKGLVYRLTESKTLFTKKLLAFLKSYKFQQTLKDKFEIKEDVQINTAIQKYLNGYCIEPHPDRRRKALTYLVNINKNDISENLNIHTNLYTLNPPYHFVYDFYEKNPHIDRNWVYENWCTPEKTTSDNNSIIIFKPHSYSLHGVKCDYNHLPFQRTQIYGNLEFTFPPTCESPRHPQTLSPK